MIIKTLKSTAIAAALLSTATAANANALGLRKFHAGIDAMGTTVKWKSIDKDNKYKGYPKNPFAVGLFVGGEFHSQNKVGFGVELGIDYMQKTGKKTATPLADIMNLDATKVIAAATTLGEALDVDALSAANVSPTIKSRSTTPYLGLTANYKVNSNFKLTGMIAAAVTFNKVDFTLNEAVLTNNGVTINNAKNKVSAKKTAFAPMARVGLQYDFTENFGVRAHATYRYLNSAKLQKDVELKKTTPATVSAKIGDVQLKANKSVFMYGAGLVVSF